MVKTATHNATGRKVNSLPASLSEERGTHPLPCSADACSCQTDGALTAHFPPPHSSQVAIKVMTLHENTRRFSVAHHMLKSAVRCPRSVPTDQLLHALDRFFITSER